MQRREFITFVGGALAWPLAAQAQPGGRLPRVGVILSVAENDPDAQRRIQALLQGLDSLGWVEGRNIRFQHFFGVAGASRTAAVVTELVAGSPDVIVANGTPVLTALRQATKSIPVVFVQVTDPVGGGLVESLARPGGNITGFSDFEFGTATKWLELLTELAPGLNRAAVLVADGIAPNERYLRTITEAASPLGISITPVRVRETADIEPRLSDYAQASKGGLIVLPSPIAAAQRETIIAIAARHKLLAVYPFRFFVVSGGLLSYGADNADLYRRSATYVDRILKGTPPGELPVQLPTKFELAINLKTAKAIDITVPPTLLARADDVIE